jgi:hypothetical protein
MGVLMPLFLNERIDKMKVFELSKELNVDNKELLQLLSELGIEAKSHLSVLSDEQVQEVKSAIGVPTVPKVQKKKWTPDLNRMICVKNIARGKLIYISKRQMGYTIEWAKKGDINYIELSELVSLKNTDRRFVTEPWIRIVEDDEIEILKYLNVLKYYEDILGINNISEILQLDFNSFKKKFDNLPKGYRNAVAEQAAEMIKNGTLDSIRIKEYIEKEMNIDLDILIKSDKKKINTIDIR